MASAQANDGGTRSNSPPPPYQAGNVGGGVISVTPASNGSPAPASAPVQSTLLPVQPALQANQTQTSNVAFAVLPVLNAATLPHQPQSVQITLGNTAGDHRSGGDRPTFAWQFFVQFDSTEAASWVENVTVGLHPTFQPSSKTLRFTAGSKEARTEMMRGWGVFEVDVTVCWDKTKVTSPAATRLTWTLQADQAEASETSQIVVKLGNAQSTNETSGTSALTPPGRTTAAAALGQPRASVANENKRIDVKTDSPKDGSHTVIGMVVDRSGSMSKMGDEIHGGCNAYLDEQRKTDSEDGSRSTVIFTRFDNRAETIFDGVPLQTMAPITKEDVRPRGSTALYDAIGETLQRTAAVVNALPEMPSVTIFILTDGAENASQRWNKKQITAEIKRLQHESIGWDFYFAAANQDGMKEGSALGMDRDQCTTWSQSSGKCSYAFKQSAIAYNRKKKGGIKGYTAMERMEMTEE